MTNINIINKFIELGIRTWLKTITTNIQIKIIKLNKNNKSFDKIDKLYLEATNIIYRSIYINKIIIKISDFSLQFNYKNHLIYSQDLIINSLLTIDSKNLENIIFNSKWESLKLKIQDELAEGNNLLNLVINDDFITLNYEKNKHIKELKLSLYLDENLIFLEDINNKNKILIPLDKNIKCKKCNIKNKLINLDLSSEVIFDY